jgi:stage V sporulation protein G
MQPLSLTTMVQEISVIKGTGGLFISFPNRTQSEGTQRDIAFPVNAETRDMIEEAVLAEYAKIVTPSEPLPSKDQKAQRKK